MYDSFNKFIDVDTWHTLHPTDERRFYLALHRVIREDDFSPEEMGEYMRQKKNVNTRDGSHPFEKTIDELVSRAWAVRDYLKYTSE